MWQVDCLVVGLGLGLVLCLLFDGYESACITSVRCTILRFADDELTVWRVEFEGVIFYSLELSFNHCTFVAYIIK